MKKSKFLSLSKKDLIKGLIMAILGTIVGILYTSISAGVFPLSWLEWKPLLLAGLGTGLAYILKNFFSNSEDGFLKKELPKVV